MEWEGEGGEDTREAVLRFVARRDSMCGHENCAAVDLFEYVYDHRVVRALEVSKGATAGGDSGELADCVFWVLLSGAGEPDWLRGVHRVSAQDNSGIDHAVCVRGVCVLLFGRSDEVELCGVVFICDWGGDVRVLGKALI